MPAGKKRVKTTNTSQEDDVATKKARRVSHPSYELQTNGLVLTVGQGDVGQLGLGEDITERKRPTVVSDIQGKDVVQIISGGMHTAVLSRSGELFTWGCNDEGALGRATSSDDGDEYMPAQVQLPVTPKIVQVSAGDSHTAVLLEDGSVYAWGTFRDSNGPIGLTPNGQSKEPIKVYPTKDSEDRAVKITSGNDHIVILTEGGMIFTFGSGEQGQLGRIKECFTHRGGRRGISLLLAPQIVRFKKKQKFKDIFTGSFHTFAVSDGEDDVYAWGLNNFGQLGTGDTFNQFSPTVVDSLTEIRKESGKEISFAGGQHHSLILDNNGIVYGVGRSDYGRLGLGEEAKETSEPKKIKTFAELKVKYIACGEACSFAVTTTGDLYSWGLGNTLQLGNGSEDDALLPVHIQSKNVDPRKHEVICVSSGGQHTAILVKERNPEVNGDVK